MNIKNFRNLINNQDNQDLEDHNHKYSFCVYAGHVLKNLFSKPATTSYPYEPAHFSERMRGHIEINAPECIGCGMCMRMCPPGAIHVDRAANTWSINPFDCVQCGSCVHNCPKKCLSMNQGYTEPESEKAVFTVVIPEKKIPPKKPAAAPAGEN
ncbi:MAG TPA: 4Fe-4S dicluster domain-containing protein [Candidatus Alectryocaccobium stercorigallinarum]|nr:4Fe-4S dicluster domain-containing protein [Candidatus Alectryocaccobium stercorigallinarum]